MQHELYSLQSDDIIDPSLLVAQDLDVHFDFSAISSEEIHLPDMERPYSLRNSKELSTTRGSEERVSRALIRQTSAHRTRRKLGQDLVLRLDARCARLRKVCEQRLHNEVYKEIIDDFSSMENIWESGVESFRQITRNECPSTLSNVLQCLLVADTLSYQLSPDDEVLQSQ